MFLRHIIQHSKVSRAVGKPVVVYLEYASMTSDPQRSPHHQTRLGLHREVVRPGSPLNLEPLEDVELVSSQHYDQTYNVLVLLRRWDRLCNVAIHHRLRRPDLRTAPKACPTRSTTCPSSTELPGPVDVYPSSSSSINFMATQVSNKTSGPQEYWANLPNRYSALCWRPVTHAQTWASYSTLYRFGRLFEYRTAVAVS